MEMPKPESAPESANERFDKQLVYNSDRGLPEERCVRLHYSEGHGWTAIVVVPGGRLERNLKGYGQTAEEALSKIAPKIKSAYPEAQFNPESTNWTSESKPDTREDFRR